jgi:hypothetical protein
LRETNLVTNIPVSLQTKLAAHALVAEGKYFLEELTLNIENL